MCTFVSSFTQGQYITLPKHKANDFVEDDMQQGGEFEARRDFPRALQS